MANTNTDVKLNDLHGSSDHIDDALPSVDKETLTETKSDELGMTDEEYNAAEKSLVRKLDFTLVPMVWLLYLFNYLDRNNIAYVVCKSTVSSLPILTSSLARQGSAALSKI